jgi:hypothetical protein
LGASSLPTVFLKEVAEGAFGRHSHYDLCGGCVGSGSRRGLSILCSIACRSCLVFT